MQLIYPKEKAKWNPKQLPSLPTKDKQDSGFLLIACAMHGFDLYAAFTDHDRRDVWIEKASRLDPSSHALAFEMLVRIEDEKEFTFAHQYFIKEGFLDTISKKA
jgi:hypothetical protein